MGKGTNENQSGVKRKVVYFNLEDEDELELFEKAIKKKNFSKWVKKHLQNDGAQSSIVEQTKAIEEKKIEKSDIDDMML